jgi:hypothetical protein
MNELAITSHSLGYAATDLVAKQWLAQFAELYGVNLVDRGERFVKLWVAALSDLEPEILDAACRKAIQTCKFFPMPAEIRAHVETGEDSRGEDEWQNLLEYCRRYVHPDTGITAPKPLPPDIKHAADAAGGLYRLESCPTDELQWAKKRFVEDLTRQRTSGQIVALLPESELGKMLHSHASRLALPAAPDRPRLALDDGAKQFVAQPKSAVSCLSERQGSDGIVTITSEIRAQYEEKKAEALRRFGVSHELEPELLSPGIGARS